MCLHHTQTCTRMRVRTHTGAHLHLLALLPSSDSDLSGCCSSILHTQHFPLLPLQSVHMSYEGMREGDEGACEWAECVFGDEGRCSVTKTCLNWWVSLTRRRFACVMRKQRRAVAAYGDIYDPYVYKPVWLPAPCCHECAWKRGAASHSSRCFLVSSLMNQGPLRRFCVETNAPESH